MTEKTRLTDKIKISCPHGAIGTITTSSDNVFLDDLKAARIGDEVTCDVCGKKGKIVSASSNIFINDRKVARIDDVAVGECNVGAKCCPHTWTGTVKSGSADETDNKNDNK